jgi:hypothetical protein
MVDFARLITMLEFNTLALDTLVQRAAPEEADRLLDLAIEHAKNTMPRDGDIRFDRRPVAVEHESARGEIVRNVGAFTRGSQLIRLRYMMMMEGCAGRSWQRSSASACCLSCCWPCSCASMRCNSSKCGSLPTFGSGRSRSRPQRQPDVAGRQRGADDHRRRADYPDVAQAWTKFMRCMIVALAGSLFFSGPLATWFVRLSQKIGVDILKERHERGAMLVSAAGAGGRDRCAQRRRIRRRIGRAPPDHGSRPCGRATIAERVALGLHVPYAMAGSPIPGGSNRPTPC